MDAKYYRERERTELRMAEQAAGREAHAIHGELARRYRALAETETEATLERPERRAAAG